jgi:sialic acid synthase SpsE
LETLVRGIRVVESALGDGRKRPAASEEENRGTVRRSLAARLDIPRGTLLTAAHLQPLRPATGLPPTLLRHVVGRETKRELKEGELITWSDLV